MRDEPFAEVAAVFDDDLALPDQPVAEVAAAVASHVPHPAATILVGPSEAGEHVDHRVVARALARVSAALHLRYDDQPYVLTGATPAAGGRTFHQVFLDAATLHAKQRHLALYPSQPTRSPITRVNTAATA